MSRQIEIDFYSLDVTSTEPESVSTDLFDAMESKTASSSIALALENKQKTAKITVQVFDGKEDIFGDE